MDCPKNCRQLDAGNAPLVLVHKMERQKPLCQRHMGLVQQCPCRHRGLMMALGALVSSVGQPVSVIAATFRTSIVTVPAKQS